MKKRKNTIHDFIDSEYTTFQRGIDYQRELYKQSMHQQNYDSAVTAIDNIRIEIKNKALAKQKAQTIKRINDICDWYRALPTKYRKRTEEGYVVSFPPNIQQKIIKNLNVAYELITELLSTVGLI